MGDSTSAPEQLISLPEGGGALRGIGETFGPDPQTGTGNLTVPIIVPPGRQGLTPRLDLAYSTGSGNGFFGLGWALAVPGISRKTSSGVPVYDDAADTFILSGGEDLVPVEQLAGIGTRYRPRTEGLFASVVHHRDVASGQDYWEVASKDGLVSRYGTRRPAGAASTWRDPAVLADPGDLSHIFSWKLTETRDTLGNVIVYEYDADAGAAGNHRWWQPLLRTIRYADYTAVDGTARFLATVAFGDEERHDPFSSYTAGFEIRTSRRYTTITTAVHPDADRPVRRYELSYQADSYNGVSLLTSVAVVGFDDDGGQHRDLPPVTFGYGRFEPTARRFQPVTGADPPSAALSRGDHELVDLTGDALPDVLQLNGVARYWRNLGGGRFDRPRSMTRAPAGLALTDPGVQLLDADGDGRVDLLVATPSVAGYFPLRFGPSWGDFRRYRNPPSFGLNDPEVRLIDLDGDGVTDALHAGSRLECYFADADTGWRGPQPTRAPGVDGPPPLTLADPRVRWADMSGDGLTDLVLVHDRNVEYWPNLGHGRWGARLRMTTGPQLPTGYDPALLLLGDLDGDGLADLAYADGEGLTVWFNRSGNGWSEPVRIPGVPAAGWDVRSTDLLGTGTPGVLWSQDATPSGRPSMYFLDLTGGVKPRLLSEVDNHIGALTRVGYRPSTAFSTIDSARPDTLWRTPLPFVVPVVAEVETIDRISGGKLTSTYSYRHGYWDGAEREFRGFGRVEQTDTETFPDYHNPGLHPGTPFGSVGQASFSAPTLTRTWFHLGPVETDDEDQWAELDLQDEYWTGDPHLLDQAGRTSRFLRGLHDFAGGSDRRARRDALRALRGHALRTELYGLDDAAERDRPYTVTEHAYELREEPTAGIPGRPRVFAVFEAAARTTQWERGTDPMTRFTFTGAHDPHGQPQTETVVAPSRRSTRRQPVTVAPVRAGHGRLINPDETQILATHTRTGYAEPGPGVSIHDRVAQVRHFELADRPTVNEQTPDDVHAVLADQLAAAEAVRDTFNALVAADVRLIGHVVHHYDGAAYAGLDAGQVGSHGLLTRSEALVFADGVGADDTLDAAYGQRRPAYLGGLEPLPTGAPAAFGADLGYRHEPGDPADTVHVPGRYVDTARHAYDVQLSTPADPLPARGLRLGAQDPLHHEIRVTPDPYWLFPEAVTDPAGLQTTVDRNYRAGQPSRIVEPNGNATNYVYHPLGPLSTVFLKRRDGGGGSEDKPEIRYSYDLFAYALHGQPISVHTTARIWPASDVAAGTVPVDVGEDVIESREYSDGFGRLMQKRTQAEDLAFGTSGDDAGLLVPDPQGVPQPLPGQAGGPAVGTRVADRVVVSGWQVYDNKGRVIERYEPFFDSGFQYQPESQPRRGQRVFTCYDPRGQVVRVVNPDGSQRRTVFGLPDDLGAPDDVDPTPWVVTTYDENDLASRASTPVGATLAGRAPTSHHFTPATSVVDSLGRPRCQIVRGGPDPASDWHATQTTYDIRGNPLTIVDELGRTAFTYAYDLANRVLRVDGIDSGRRTTVIDAAGNTVATRDGRDCVSLRTHDVLNRPTAVFARDLAGLAVTMRQQLTYGDGGDRAQPPTDRAAAGTHNRLGRLWQHLDEAGLVTVEEYDLTGKVTSQVRQVVSDAAIAAAEPDGWTANWGAPNARGALDPAQYRITSRYDALGRAVQVTAPTAVAGEAGRVITPAYSRSGALRSVAVDGVPYIRLLAHNARGQRVLAAYGNGTPGGTGPGPVTRYAYHQDTFALIRLRTERMVANADTWAAAGVGILQDYSYAYDLVGNLTAVEERLTGCGIAGTADGRDGLVRSFGYDPLYRLTSATGRACSDLGALRPLDDALRCGSYPSAPSQANAPDVTDGYRESYTYDPAGNLLDLLYEVTTGLAKPSWHRAFGMGGLAPQAWAEAPTNRMTSVRNGSRPAMTLAYDDAGNLQAETDSRHFTFDHAGRLVAFAISAGAGTSVSARYLYGADGLRVKKWVRRNNASFLDETTVCLGDLVEHHWWTKQGGGHNSLLHVMDGAARVALIRGGVDVHPDDVGPAVRYELSDHLGSAALTLDATGNWTNREEYFPYGETSFGSFRHKRYRFTGKERDEESGLNYHGARYYAACFGKWISPDPIGAAEGCNGFRYARNNPIGNVDPRGTQSARATFLSPDTHGARLLTGTASELEAPDGPDPPMAPAIGTDPWEGPTLSAGDPAQWRYEKMSNFELPPEEAAPLDWSYEGLGFRQALGFRAAYSIAYGIVQRYRVVRDWIQDFGPPAPVAYVGSNGRVQEMIPPRRDHTAALGVLAEIFLFWATAKAGGGPTISGAESGLAPLATESGTATVYQQGRHAVVEVQVGDTILRTEKVRLGSGLTTVAEAPTLGPGRAVTLELPSAQAAMNYQRSIIGKPMGLYNENINSCVTHCGDVLRAGGLDVPSTTRGIVRWLRSQ